MNAKPLLRSLSNAALYLGTCALIGTGLLLEVRMDEEDGAPRLLGMGADDWGEIHFAVALTFVGLTVLHLMLNWPWVKATLKHRKSARLVLGVGAFLVAALLVWPSDHPSPVGGHQPRSHERDDD